NPVEADGGAGWEDPLRRLAYAYALEAPLAAAEVASAAFRLRAILRGRRTEPASASATPATAGKSARSAGSPVFGFGHPDLAPFQLMAFELLDRGGRLRVVAELDEGESSRPAGGAVGGEENFDHLADLGKQRLEIALGRVVTEVADEHSRADDRLLFLGSAHPLSAGSEVGSIRDP